MNRVDYGAVGDGGVLLSLRNQILHFPALCIIFESRYICLQLD